MLLKIQKRQPKLLIWYVGCDWCVIGVCVCVIGEGKIATQFTVVVMLLIVTVEQMDWCLLCVQEQQRPPDV